MNGLHDMGGMHGFGPIVIERDELPFQEEWQKRAFALTIATGATGAWNLDMSRQAREDRPALQYLQQSYFEIWIAAVIRLLIERGLVTESEVASGVVEDCSRSVPRVLAAENVVKALSAGGPTVRPTETPARFAVGSQVRAKTMNPRHHTRLPRYVRGHVGTVQRVHGCHVFADSNATGKGEDPQWLYTVGFEGAELWGGDADPKTKIFIDAWEPYLERADV